MPGKLRQPIPPISLPLLTSPPLASGGNAGLRGKPALPLPSKGSKKKKKIHASKPQDQAHHPVYAQSSPYAPSSSYAPYDRWYQSYAHNPSWTVPVRDVGYTERVATPWHYKHPTSSTESLNGWTPWTSWQRAHAKSDKYRDPYKGRTFEAVPVTSLNLEDHYATRKNVQKTQNQTQPTQKVSTQPTDGAIQTKQQEPAKVQHNGNPVKPQKPAKTQDGGIPEKPQKVVKVPDDGILVKPQKPTKPTDDGIRVKAVAFDDNLPVRRAQDPSAYQCVNCSSPVIQTRFEGSTSSRASVSSEKPQERFDSDRSYIEGQGLGPAVTRGLAHYPPTPHPSPASSRPASDHSSVRSWDSEWKMRHLC